MLSEQLFDIFDNLPCSFSVLKEIKSEAGEVEDFIFIYTNTHTLKLLHLKEPQIINRKLTEILPVKTTPLLQYCKEVMKNGIPQIKIKVNDDIDVYIARLNDYLTLSWEQCTEEKLKKSQYILRLLLDHINEGILVSDVINDRVLAVSKWGLEQTIGASIDEILNLSIREYLQRLNTYDVKTGKKAAPEDLSTSQALMGRITRGEEWRVIRPDDSEIIVRINAAPIYNEDGTKIIHTIATWADITEQKKAEQALIESEERFRTLADNITQQVWISDLDGTPVWFNKRWIDFSGYSQEELINISAKEGEHPIYLKDVFQRYYDCIAKKEKWEDIFTLKDSNGDYCWFLSRAVPIYDDNGSLVRWFGTNTDITKQIKLEEDLAERVKEREVLLKELYHRTKNNMQVISSLLSIKSVMVSNPELATVFREMQGRIQAISLVHEKLYRSENLSKIYLPEYIKNLAELLLYSSSIHKSKIKFKYDLDEIAVQIDIAVHCGLIITELILNSIKHAFPGDMMGYIEIKLKQLEDQFIELTISDNGISMKESDFTDDEKSFGLELFRELVNKQLNGTFVLDTSKGVSWTVRFKNKPAHDQL